MTVLAAARVVSGDGGLSAAPAWVAFADGRITATGTGAPPGGDVVDLGDALLTPGFVDIQVNGTASTDFATAAEGEVVVACEQLVDGGCTTMLPTLVSAPLESYGAALERLAAVRARVPAVLGVHLEGPFLGGAPGAHSPDLVRPVDLDWLLGTCDRFGDLVQLVTLAPEADAGLHATRALAERGVIVSVGHSTASYDETRAAADAGARVVTHVFNGMGPLHHRAPGVAGAALDDRRLVPTLIADLVHVHPAMVRVAVVARPDLVLVTDAVAAVDVPARDGAARLADGTLAGSTLTMVDAVRNVVGMGIPIGQAVRMAGGNAARILGRSDRGRLAPGSRADIVALDPTTLTPRSVWVGGDRRDS
ncbi:MAG: N-acetylglucosamine-6-phosphate deacetylase [Actinomycetota bacterium]